MKVASEKPKLKKIQSEKAEKPSQWQSLVNSLLRPPRMRYSDCHMGYKVFNIRQQVFNRTDQTISHENKKIQLTTFIPQYRNNKLILYLHGNSSSKLQSKGLLPFLPSNYSLAAFDFIGCGNNMQNDIITLGYSQSKQVQTVVNHLRSQHFQVFLWGRSMGAVSALLYGKADVIVADSPFRSMKKLCKQLSTSKVNPLPNAIVHCLFPCVFLKLKSDIKLKGNYDLDELNTEKAVRNISPTTTLIFLTGSQDDLIHHHNSQKLFEMFPGDKKYLQIVPGSHNSKRPDEIIQKIMQIIDKSSEEHQTIQDSITKQQIKIRL